MTPMPCGECRPLLLDHAYDALPPAEAAAVAAHLDTCPACRAAVADVRRVQGLIAAAAKAPFPGVVFAPPADVRPAAAPARRPASRWIGWAVAASLLAAVGGLGVPALLDATRYAKHRMDVDGRMAEVAAADATRAGLRADLTGKVKAAADRKAAAERAHNDVGDRWIAAEVALKTKEARTYEVEIVGPRTAIPGAPNEYRLNVTDTQKRPYAATMDAVVKTSGGAELFAQRFEADKNPDGNVLRLPAGAWANVKAGEDVLLHIMAVDPKTGTKSELTENLKLLEPVYATFLTTDKPMYRPGEVVFFRSLTLDRTRFLPPQKETTLRFEIKAPSGQVLPGSQQMGLAKPVAVSKDGRMHSVIGPDGQPVRGVGTGAFPLGDDLAGGEYTLNVWEVPQPGEAAKSSHNKPLAVRKFVVNKYTPDRMVKTLEFDGKSYGPGDVVQAKLTLKDQSKPLANAVLSVTADADGQPLKLDVAPAKTDADGVASIKLTLPKSDDLKEVRLNVTATANRITESIPRRVPLAARTLDVEFFPEGGDLVAGVPNRVYFRARTGNGQPADLTGTLTDGLADLAGVQTLKDADRPGANQGMGSFTFTPVTGKRYAVRLSTPASVRPPVIGALGNDHAAAIGSQAALAYRGYPLPDAKAAGVVLHAPAGLVKAGDPIRVRLTSHAPRTVFVGAYTRGRPVGSAKVAIPGPAGVEVALESTDAKLGGVTRVTVFDLPTEDTLGKDELKPLAERLVYRRPTEELKIAYEARKAGAAPGGAFVPGSKLMLDITAKDETDAPKPAILWAAIVNKSVLAMADEKTERMQPTHFLLNGEVQKGEDLEFADFLLTDHPTAAAALDLLLGTQGWRRFAEQRQEYRQKKLSPEEAEQLLLASATTGPIPTGWQNDLRKVFDTYWPKYESTQIDLEEAETAKARVDNDLSPLPAISRADAEYVAKLRAFREPAADLTADAAALDRRRGTLPYLLTGLLALAAAGFAIRYLAFAPGAPARAPLGIGAVGFVLLAGFLAVTTYATGRNNDGWRAVAKAAEMPSPTEAPQDPAETTRADRLRNSPPVIEALDNLNDGKGLKLAEEKAAGRPEPKADALAPAGAPPDVAAMALPAPAPPGAVPPPVAAPALKLAPQAAPAMGGVRPMMMRAGPKPADDDKAKEQREFGGDDRKDRMAKKRPANGPVPGGARFDNFMQKREQQFGLADATDARGMGQMASVPAHFRQFMPHAEPFPVREYAHVWAAPANGSDAREDFAETLLWQPVLVTPKDGRLTVEFALSDAIQPYRVLIAGHTTDGRLGAVTGVIEVRKPFSLDVKLPQEIGSGDVLQVPVLGTNATDADVAAALKVTPTGFTLGSPDGPTLDLPSAGGSRLLLRAAPAKTEGTLAIEVAGKAGSNTDSVKRTVTVVPDGFPVQGSASDVLEKSFRTSMKLPEMLVPGSLKLRVTMYPNTLSEVQNGLEGMLREPYGCFEQSSTTNYPNVLVLDYLTETNQAKPDVAKRAKELLDRGYGRLTSYECRKPTNGQEGYEWFGGTAPPHEALTAYGLLQFTDMARVHPVDAEMLKRTKAYLLSRRNGKGGFDRNPRALDSFGGAPADVTDAYIVWAITEAERTDPNPSDLKAEIAAVLAQARADKRKTDPYFLALAANALLNRGMREEGTGLLKVLAELQAKDGSSPGAETSITRSSGQALLIESTALAVLGWLKANEAGAFRPNVELACRYLGGQRGGSGAFGSTQSTILALKALIAYARGNKRPAESGEIRVVQGGNVIGRKPFTTESAGPIVVEIENAEKVFAGGTAELTVETDAKQPYPTTVSWEARSRKPDSSAACPIRLATALDRKTASEGELLRMTVQVENTAATDQGMVTAIVGIPAGLKLPEDMKQLKALMEKGVDGSDPKVSYWETRGRELILYWRGMGPKGSVELTVDLLADAPGEFRGPASRAYLYYGAEHKHWVDPVDVSVTAK